MCKITFSEINYLLIKSFNVYYHHFRFPTLRIKSSGTRKVFFINKITNHSRSMTCDNETVFKFFTVLYNI